MSEHTKIILDWLTIGAGIVIVVSGLLSLRLDKRAADTITFYGVRTEQNRYEHER